MGFEKLDPTPAHERRGIGRVRRILRESVGRLRSRPASLSRPQGRPSLLRRWLYRLEDGLRAMFGGIWELVRRIVLFLGQFYANVMVTAIFLSVLVNPLRCFSLECLWASLIYGLYYGALWPVYLGNELAVMSLVLGTVGTLFVRDIYKKMLVYTRNVLLFYLALIILAMISR